MVWKPPETLDDPARGSDDHGPLRASRITPGDYAPDFLKGLQLRNEVVRVGDDWNGDSSGFPPHVTWVLYPNGDLERVGFA
jgi:hypothetical protein